MRLLIGASVCVMVMAAASTPLSAQERSSVDPPAAVQKSLVASGTDFLLASSALQQSGAAAPGAGPHKLGVGLRFGGYGSGVGGSLRSWFMPPWGFQVGVSHYGYGDFFGGFNYSSIEFAPAVLYQFAPVKMDAPLSLRPFVGGGVSIIRSSFSYADNVDTTNTGVLILGGVELFFAKVPKLGVSGELEFTPSNDPFQGVSGVGGPGFVVLAHWYLQ